MRPVTSVTIDEVASGTGASPASPCTPATSSACAPPRSSRVRYGALCGRWRCEVADELAHRLTLGVATAGVPSPSPRQSQTSSDGIASPEQHPRADANRPRDRASARIARWRRPGCCSRADRSLATSSRSCRSRSRRGQRDTRSRSRPASRTPVGPARPGSTPSTPVPTKGSDRSGRPGFPASISWWATPNGTSSSPRSSPTSSSCHAPTTSIRPSTLATRRHRPRGRRARRAARRHHPRDPLRRPQLRVADRVITAAGGRRGSSSALAGSRTATASRGRPVPLLVRRHVPAVVAVAGDRSSCCGAATSACRRRTPRCRSTRLAGSARLGRHRLPDDGDSMEPQPRRLPDGDRRSSRRGHRPHRHRRPPQRSGQSGTPTRRRARTPIHPPRCATATLRRRDHPRRIGNDPRGARLRCSPPGPPAGSRPVRNAERIVTAGAGLQLLKDDLTVDAVRDALRAVLDDASYRRSAERIQTEIHEMPDARDAVTRIEALTRS